VRMMGDSWNRTLGSVVADFHKSLALVCVFVCVCVTRCVCVFTGLLGMQHWRCCACYGSQCSHMHGVVLMSR
jgi:hypothetical protein